MNIMAIPRMPTSTSPGSIVHELGRFRKGLPELAEYKNSRPIAATDIAVKSIGNFKAATSTPSGGLRGLSFVSASLAQAGSDRKDVS
jgi:hypothetical protein